MQRNLWILIALLAVTSTQASIKPMPAATAATTGTASQGSPPTATASQVAILTNEVHLLRSFQSETLNTVYWALGAVFLLAVLIAGGGWWTNVKLYERDKSTLIADVNRILEAAIATHKREQTDASLIERTRVDKAIIALSADFQERIQHATSEERAKTTLKHNELKQLVEENYRRLSRTIAHRAGRALLYAIQSDHRRAEDDELWPEALTLALNQLDVGLEISSDYYIKDALKGLITAMDHGGHYYKSELEELRGMLPKLSDRFSELRDQLSSKLQSASVRDDPS